MKKLNEKKIIEIIQKQIGKNNFSNDDVDLIKLGSELFALKTDTLVESTDIPPGTDLKLIVRKSIVACVSDFISKSIIPTHGIVSLVIPKRFTKKDIQKISRGIYESSKEFKIKFIGGDTNEGKELIITIFLFGKSNKIVNRKGAQLNHLIITTGNFGYTRAGLEIVLKGIKTKKNFTRKSIDAFLRPKPWIEFSKNGWRWFSSSMDSSDGLGITLNTLAQQNKKKFLVNNFPIPSDLARFSQESGISLYELIFKGGEEYQIVATVPPKKLKDLLKFAKKINCPISVIGVVQKGRGVFYSGEKPFPSKIKNEGWIHLSNGI